MGWRKTLLLLNLEGMQCFCHHSSNILFDLHITPILNLSWFEGTKSLFTQIYHKSGFYCISFCGGVSEVSTAKLISAHNLARICNAIYTKSCYFLFLHTCIIYRHTYVQDLTHTHTHITTWSSLNHWMDINMKHSILTLQKNIAIEPKLVHLNRKRG